ncbi:MAG: hypothetical protein ACE5G1_08970 [bacterium]
MMRALEFSIGAIVSLVLLGCAGIEKVKNDAPPTREERNSNMVAQLSAEIIANEGQETSYGIPLSLRNIEKFKLFYEKMNLTLEQEKIRNAALVTIPAPCCPDNPMSTCCCTCNLAKSVWGLSNYLVKERGYDTEQVRAEALQWLRFIRAGYYIKEELVNRGIELGSVGLSPEKSSCYTGRCNLSLKEGGCGGMG